MDHYEKACELLKKAESATTEYASTFIRLAEIHLDIWKNQNRRNTPPHLSTWNEGN